MKCIHLPKFKAIIRRSPGKSPGLSYVTIFEILFLAKTVFGLGFERFLMYLTGMDIFRDVIPFPRRPNEWF